MRTLIIFAILAAGAWAAVNFVPAEVKTKAVDSLVASSFIHTTIPKYARLAGEYVKRKLTIPESPAAKRKQLIDELALDLTQAKRELASAVPPRAHGLTPPLPPAADVRAGVRRAEEEIAKSDSILEELRSQAADQGVVSKTALRVLDAIFPPATTSTACLPPK